MINLNNDVKIILRLKNPSLCKIILDTPDIKNIKIINNQIKIFSTVTDWLR